MPELPEVETVARQLDPVIRGKKVQGVEVLDSKLKGPNFTSLSKYKIDHVRRVGKRVVIDFSKGTSKLWVAVHLRMTGRLIWAEKNEKPRGGPPAAAKRAPSEKTKRMVFKLTGGELRFHDTRRFGTVELHEQEPRIPNGSLDPVGKEFSARNLEELLRGARGEIKPWLMRQDKLPGMGNIYASEALYRARIHPRRDAGSLNHDEIKRLRKGIADVLKAAIENCGTTFADFMDSTGEVGNFARFLRVYGKAGQNCPGCKGKIERIIQQQRSTFFCPACQL